MQISVLHLGFQPGTGCTNMPMQSSDFNPLVAAISLYLDDGSGVFEIFSDSLIYTETGPLTLVNGQITLNLPDQHSDLQIVPQASKDYFVTLGIRANASSQTCHGFIPFFFAGFIPGINDIFRAQDRDSGIELNGFFTATFPQSEQTIIASTNTAPITTGILDQNGIEDTFLTINISSDFSDPDGDDLFYTAVGLPLTLSMNGTTGEISGTPNNLDVANSPFGVNVTVRDPQGATVNSVFNLAITDPNAPLFTGPIGTQNGLFNILFTLNASTFFVDPNADVLTFSADVLPDGLSISTDGNISGTPTAIAFTQSPYAVIITAEDPSGATVSSNQFVFNITDATNDVIFANSME